MFSNCSICLICFDSEAIYSSRYLWCIVVVSCCCCFSCSCNFFCCCRWSGCSDCCYCCYCSWSCFCCRLNCCCRLVVVAYVVVVAVIVVAVVALIKLATVWVPLNHLVLAKDKFWSYFSAWLTRSWSPDLMESSQSESRKQNIKQKWEFFLEILQCGIKSESSSATETNM